ncbi:MAG TPA: hypothetical protein VFQ31_06290, partial [Methyloceanibacter sp.]|nr:hypothetical protein [Methyloceanibacter sp.]
CSPPTISKFVETASGAGRIEFSYPVTMSNVVQMTDFVLMRLVTRIRAAAESHWRPCLSASCIANPPISPNTNGDWARGSPSTSP